MKTKLFILFAIFGLLLFSNCQTEDNAIDDDNHSKFSMKKISFQEMKSKPKAVEALNKIRETKTVDAQAKLVYDSANDFYVDTDEIIYIEKGDDYHSYTFAVYREGETPLFENLVMSLQKDGSYSATLVSYNLTEQEKKALEEEKLLSLEGKLSAKVLDPGTYNPEYLLGRTNCYSVNVATCSQGTSVHIAGPGCTRVDGYVTLRVCYETSETVFHFDDNASGDNGGGGTGDSGGGGTGNPNPNPDPTPDTDPEDEEPEEGLGDAPVTIPLIKNPKGNPCEELKAKTQETVFKNKAAYLNQPNIFALDHETGFAETRNPANLAAPLYLNLTAAPNTHRLTIPATSRAIGFTHVHNDDFVVGGVTTHTIKMLSPKDIESLIISSQKHALTLGVSTSQTYGIMISSQGTYAIKLLMPTATTTAEVDTEFNVDFDEFTKQYTKKSNQLINDDNLTPSSTQKMFLQFLKKYSLDDKVGLFKATNADLTEWSRVTLNGSNLIETPCN